MSDVDHTSGAQGHGRRDFLYIATGAFAAVGAATAVWPFIDSMNPSGDVLALATIEVDISSIAVGQAITVKWQGKPVFIRHRTEEEIAAAANVAMAEPIDWSGNEDQLVALPDPQSDEDRTIKPEWLILVGVCTHLGCVPLGQKTTDQRGEFGGWFCPCHGSHYDTSGRIVLGPAPLNLEVPDYSFLNDTNIRIG